MSAIASQVLERSVVVTIAHAADDGYVIDGSAVDGRRAVATGLRERSTVRLELDAAGTVVAASGDELTCLVARTMTGVRRDCAEGRIPGVGPDGPAAALLDDLPVLWLLRRELHRRRPGAMFADGVDRFAAPVGICAGWAEGGELHRASLRGLPIEAETVVRVGLRRQMPVAPVGRRAPRTVCRQRLTRVALSESGDVRVESWLRDSYAKDATNDSLMHEYAVEVVVDRTDRISSVEVRPGRLPVAACTGALASVPRMRGLAITEVDAVVRAQFRGDGTCTHLNDAYRHVAAAVSATRSALSGDGSPGDDGGAGAPPSLAPPHADRR